MRCDAMLVCQGLHPCSDPILDETMIGRVIERATLLALLGHASHGMVRVVVVQHVRMHRACESSFFFFFFCSVLLLVGHHNVFEILLCAYYSEREKRERERGLVRASGSVFKQIGNKSSQKGWLSVSNWVSQHVACCLYTNSHGRY